MIGSTETIMSLRKSQLIDLTFDSSLLWLNLEFVLGQYEKTIVIQLQQLIHLVILKEPDDEECPFYVGDIKLTPLPPGNNVSDLIPFQYNSKIENIEVSSSQPLFYLYIDGGIHIEAVFRAYQFQEENHFV